MAPSHSDDAFATAGRGFVALSAHIVIAFDGVRTIEILWSKGKAPRTETIDAQSVLQCVWWNVPRIDQVFAVIAELVGTIGVHAAHGLTRETFGCLLVALSALVEITA